MTYLSLKNASVQNILYFHSLEWDQGSDIVNWRTEGGHVFVFVFVFFSVFVFVFVFVSSLNGSRHCLLEDLANTFPQPWPSFGGNDDDDDDDDDEDNDDNDDDCAVSHSLDQL